MITFYANKVSNNSNRVEYVLKLLEVPYTYKTMDFAKDLKTPEFLAINPSGKIPALKDDSFTLFESNAINKYLCNKYNGEFLYPYDPALRAKVDQWIDFCSFYVGTPIGFVVFNRIFAPQIGVPVNESLITHGLKELDRYLPLIDNHLAHHPYFVGENMTLADLSLLATLQYGDAAKIDFTPYPHLLQWRAKLQTMNFYKEVHTQ